jgi:hypothetical protein
VSTEFSSSAPDGMRKVWDLIWKSAFPPKVHHFAWRLATDSLPTWRNKHIQTLEVTDQCQVCGMEPEDNFHPFVRCNMAKQLWKFMAEKWHLPALESIEHTGVDWLISLLEKISSGMICRVLITPWRIWHVRNEIFMANQTRR